MDKQVWLVFRSFFVLLGFVRLFFYFYKRSRKFRKSISYAVIAVIVFFSGWGLPGESWAKEIDGFSPKFPERNRPNRNSGFFKSGSGKPNGSDNDGGNDGGNFPEYPKGESVDETQARIADTEQQLTRLKEVTESDSESDSETDEDVKFESKFECKADTHEKTQAGLLYFDETKGILIDKVYQEAVRRAKKNDPDYEVNFERIKQLATEHIETEEDRLYAAKETITNIQAETEGILKPGSGQRIYLGRNEDGPIQGCDMKTEGVGKWSHITHAEFKNPVGTKIAVRQKKDNLLATKSTAAIAKDNDNITVASTAKKIVKRTRGQINYWTNSTKYGKLDGLVKDPNIPESADNILVIVDLFDVPEYEKAEMKQEMIAAAEGKIKNMIFLNDKTNI